MAIDYADTASTALTLLKEAGTAQTLRKQTSGAYDPATGKAAITPVDHTCTVVTPPASNGTIQGFDTREDGLEIKNLRFIIMAASGLSVRPSLGDHVIIDGIKYRVGGLTAVEPAGVPIIYRIGGVQTS